jgi:hypothetical protein
MEGAPRLLRERFVDLRRCERSQAFLQLTLQQSELGALQQSATQVAIPNTAINQIEQLRRDLTGKSIIISDRRCAALAHLAPLDRGEDLLIERDGDNRMCGFRRRRI